MTKENSIWSQSSVGKITHQFITKDFIRIFLFQQLGYQHHKDLLPLCSEGGMRKKSKEKRCVRKEKDKI
jgi:hypothetical protein